MRARIALRRYRHVTVAHSCPNADKIKGLLPQTVDCLRHLDLAEYIINEADGAAGQPLKAPKPTEPVMPSSTSLVVAVVGIEAIGRPLLAENAFRIENISRLTGLKEGDIITTEAVATLLTHPQGIIQYAPEGRIVPLINKVGEKQAAQAEALAIEVLRRQHPQIARVVFGEVRRPACPLTVVFVKTDGLDDNPKLP